MNAPNQQKKEASKGRIEILLDRSLLACLLVLFFPFRVAQNIQSSFNILFVYVQCMPHQRTSFTSINQSIKIGHFSSPMPLALALSAASTSGSWRKVRKEVEAA